MKPEITWSIMHPTALDVEYMKRVVKESERYNFDSFEICGPCHGLDSGLDGVLDYKPYPTANEKINKNEVSRNCENLNTIVELAHSINKPVFYWHREVIVPNGMLEDTPLLLDENGEFNLLGESFEELVRYKINTFFEEVPQMDGLVLTLTEADYSVIHNSNTEKYPPVKVVEKIVRIFASESEKRNKRFVLRSFGSIKQDYEDIMAGAEMAAKDYAFEIETKITPYDFVPFLDKNPFLYKINNCTLSAECDSLGEFLGAGFLPAANVDNIVRYVNEGKDAEVERFVIRIDRVGNSIFDAHEINLFAYHQSIENNCNPEEIWKKWADIRWKECSEEMVKIGKASYDFISKTNYIDKNVIFHKFPPDENISWLKLGGIFALFSNGKSLDKLSGIWSIMSNNSTPGRENILKEKLEAIEIAENSLNILKSVKDKLPENEFNIAFRLWNNAVYTAKALHLFCKAVCGYFDAIGEKAKDIDNLIESLKNDFENLEKEAPSEVLKIYIYPLKGMMLSLKNDFKLEASERQQQSEASDLLVCGSLTDEWRTGRYQHGSKTLIHNNRLGREIGNRVFPNGFIATTLSIPENPKNVKLRIEGAVDVSKEFKLTIDGKSDIVEFDSSGVYQTELPASSNVEIKIEKAGTAYPVIHTLALYSC